MAKNKAVSDAQPASSCAHRAIDGDGMCVVCQAYPDGPGGGLRRDLARVAAAMERLADAMESLLERERQ